MQTPSDNFVGAQPAGVQFADAGIAPWTPGRRVAFCILASIFLHVALVLWVKHEPVDVNLRPLSEPFFLFATLRHDLWEGDKPVVGPDNVKRSATRREKVQAQSKAGPLAGPKPEETGAPVQTQRESEPHAPAKPETHIDMEEARRIAREYSRKTVDPRFDADAGAAIAQEAGTLSSEAIAKAARPDCKSEYAGYGFLAIPLLLRDAVTNSGCKW